MNRSALRVIRDDHASLTAMLQSMQRLIDRGPDPGASDGYERYFDVMRAMLFYIDEFPEQHHHPKESNLLFPRVARAAPQVMPTIERLERDHMAGEARVRELMHLLQAWEYLGEARRAVFEAQARQYVVFYLEHMRLEEAAVLPEAERVLDEGDWRVLNAAFASHRDPLSGQAPREPSFDRLLTLIMKRVDGSPMPASPARAN